MKKIKLTPIWYEGDTIEIVLDEDAPYFRKRVDANMVYLRTTERYLNDLLRMKGHLMLNEVYEKFGKSFTSRGYTDGWLKGGVGIQFAVMSADTKTGKIVFRTRTDGPIIFDI